MKKERKYLTLIEIERIFQAAKNSHWSERDQCIIRVSFIHGLRVSELCNLQLTDIDLHSGVIYIRRLKNGLSTIQPLLIEEIALIKRWLAIRSKKAYAYSTYLFISQKSEKMSRQQVGRLLRKYGDIAGTNIRPHPHMLRHSCGYELANLGTDTRLIQDYLGHRNIRHTVIYTASNPERFSKLWQKR